MERWSKPFFNLYSGGGDKFFKEDKVKKKKAETSEIGPYAYGTHTILNPVFKCTVERSAWGIFNGDDELILVILDKEIKSPEYPSHERLIKLSWTDEVPIP